MHINFATKRGFEFKFDLNAILNNIKNIKFNNLTMVVVASVALFIMISFGVIQKLRLDNLHDKRQRAEIEVSQMKKAGATEGVAVIETPDETKVLQRFDSRVLWSNVLENLAQEIPSRIWLSSIKSSDKDSSKYIELDGDAPDQSAVASLVGSLGENKFFDYVELKSSDVTKTEEGKANLQFSLQCKIK